MNSAGQLKSIYEMVTLVTVSQIKSRYRKTFAGFLWVILNPVLTFAVQALIFKNILKIQTENYYLYLLSGIVPWVFITTALNMSISCFVANRPTLLAVKIPPWVLLLSQVLDNGLNYIVSYFVLVLFVSPQSLSDYYLLPLFLIASLVLTIFVFYLCFLLAMINVFFRDMQFIMAFVIGLAYFVTPIFYPISYVPPEYRFMIDINPFYIFIKPFHSLFWLKDLSKFSGDLLIAVGVLSAIMLATHLFWRKRRYAIYLSL